MSEQKQVKIVLLTGYLGAGKTTIVNYILQNAEGMRAAVIVNDIGEINVDVSLIKDGGYAKGENVIPLTNGCFCCTLSDDLARQLGDLADTEEFDYIIIEASGMCEPIPITYNISAFCDQNQQVAKCSRLNLDNIVAVVDCARMFEEFHNGRDLLANDIEEDDIESLLIQQIEFCSTLILNKCDLVTSEQLKELKVLVRSLQKDAVIVEAVNGDIPMSELMNTNRFDFDKAYASAAWVDAMEHPEEHEDPEVLEYEITTFVYRRRKPFDLDKLNQFVASWPKSIIRVKGSIWAAQDPETSYVFEQVGKQVQFYKNGLFYVSLPEDERETLFDEKPELRSEWDEELGDRQTKLCFIGRHMNRNEIEAGLDSCLTEYEPIEFDY